MEKQLIEWNLNEIKRIADFQIERIKDNKAGNKKLVLRQALGFIEGNVTNILKGLESGN